MNTSTTTCYYVRRPGNTAWSSHVSVRAAHRAAARAEQVTGLRHAVYAEHRDGSTTGPYYADADE